MDYLFYLWLAPALATGTSLHTIYMIFERKWKVAYEKNDIRETVLLSVLWPAGSAVVIMCLIVMTKRAWEKYIKNA